ncbi:MAG: hypothetical protein U0793_14115 [Gemmataceae bacterium]
MSTPTPGNAEPAKGLPPVQPPSGRFIAQLFLVPGLIVVIAVLLLVAFRYTIGSGYTPESFLKQLDNDNADIRWRGASDLAQVLKRPESVSLKMDAAFALDLSTRLKTAFDELAHKQKDLAAKLADKPEAEREAAWRKLKAERNHVRFLAAALGDFLVPVGAPVLAEIVRQDDSPDLKGSTLRRRQALWSLGHMGANLKEFAKQPADKQAEVLQALETEAGSDNEQRRAGARTALYYLARERLASASVGTVVKVDEALAHTAKSPDRYTREVTALALSFWPGDKTVPTLVELARDNGWGTLVRVPEGE